MAIPVDFETFFEPTRIWLFGKKFESLRYYPSTMNFSPYGVRDDGSLPMPPKRIERTLRRGLLVDKKGGTPKEVDIENPSSFFARIYSFSYEGHYYRLPRPLLFLVNDDGDPVGGPRGEGSRGEGSEDEGGAKQSPASKSARTNPSAQHAAPQSQRVGASRRFTAEFTGVEARDWDFSNDIRVWRVDRKDLVVCLDIEVGNYQEILLDSMIGSGRQDEDRATRSRGDIVGRGAGSFRGDMIGPHQNK